MAAPSNKRRVSVTIDAALLDAINQVSDNRSAVIEEALQLWRIQKINDQLRQYYQTQPQADRDHAAQWADFAHHQLDETLECEGLQAMAISYLLPGKIFLVKALRNLGDTKKRPAVVVSINLRNELSQTVLVVPFTNHITSGPTPTRILLKAGEGGLDTDSLATCDHLFAVRKTYLEQGPYGNIIPLSLRQIQQGIQIAIGVYPVGAIMAP